MGAELQKITVQVEETWLEAEGVRAFRLVDPVGKPLPCFSAGSHVNAFLPSGRIRQYSLASDPSRTDHYVIAVQRELQGQGGSIEIQDALLKGGSLEISLPINNFPIDIEARRHVLIAGGIGITPLIAMAQTLEHIGAEWHLHYCARFPERSAFRKVLSAHPFCMNTTFHFDNGDPSKSVDLMQLLASEAGPGTHVYCCGPRGLMEGVMIAAKDWPMGTVHFEYFAKGVVPTGTSNSKEMKESFEVVLASTGQVLNVPPDASILSVLEDNGVSVPTICGEGICGTCIVEVLEGEPDHRDYVLSDRDRQEGKKIAVCCSRAKSSRLKLAL